MCEERMTTSISTYLHVELYNRAREIIQQDHDEGKSARSRSIDIENWDDSIRIHVLPLSVGKRKMTVNYFDREEAICFVCEQHKIASQQEIGSSRIVLRQEIELYTNLVSQNVSTAKLDLRSEELGADSDELQRAAEKTQTHSEELQASLEELQATIEELTALNQEFFVRSEK